MGTTFESIHIPDGNVQAIQQAVSDAVVGMWSERFVSVFPMNRDEIGGTLARRLSKNAGSPVLDVAVYDSDVAEFAVYWEGKRVFRHLSSSEPAKTRPDARKFCELLGLEPEDADRLREIWRAADAQRQVEMTAALLGAPLEYYPDEMMGGPIQRDVRKVDQWIGDIPKPTKIRNATQAVMIQELKHFRLTVNGRDMVCSPLFYVSDEPYCFEGIHQKTVWWRICGDGTLEPAGKMAQQLVYKEEHGRLIGVSNKNGILYDSMGTLPQDFTNTSCFYILDGGRVLIPQGNLNRLLTCCDSKGNRLWTHYPDADYLGCGGEKVLLRMDGQREGDPVSILKSVDAETGKTLGWTTLNARVVYFHAYRNGVWWVSYVEDRADGGQYWLLKLDEKAQVLGKMLAENEMLQDMVFSPDDRLAYLYFYQKKVQVICTDTLKTIGELKDRALRIPCGTDSRVRCWMRCANSTMEAWDKNLDKILARHKLKGAVVGAHFDVDGNLCAVVWDKKQAILRIYKMTDK